MHDFHFPHLCLSSVQRQAYILDVHVRCTTSETFYSVKISAHYFLNFPKVARFEIHAGVVVFARANFATNWLCKGWRWTPECGPRSV